MSQFQSVFLLVLGCQQGDCKNIIDHIRLFSVIATEVCKLMTCMNIKVYRLICLCKYRIFK